MGTKRKVCIWWERRKGELVAQPPGWKPSDGTIVFSKQSQLLEFARASGLMLSQRKTVKEA